MLISFIYEVDIEFIYFEIVICFCDMFVDLEILAAIYG